MARKLVWVLAASGAIFAPLALSGAVVLMLNEDIAVALLGLAAFMLVPGALLCLALQWIVGRSGLMSRRQMAVLVLWLMAIALLLCGAGFMAGVVIVLIMAPLQSLDLQTAVSYGAIVAGMGCVGAAGALGMRRAVAGLTGAGLTVPGLARARSWSTAWIGAAILAGATVAFMLGFAFSDFSLEIMFVLVGVAAGLWMGLVSRAALADGAVARLAPTT